MWKSPANLVWIDLSYNYLVTIDDEILKFPNLQNLYLQYNYIKDLGEVRKLQKLRHLKSINLFGNHIEQIPGYRLWILGVFYEDNDCLKKLDQVVITAQEFQKMCVWNERFMTGQTTKLSKLSASYFADKKDKKGNRIEGIKVSGPPELKVGKEDQKGSES